MTSNQTTPAQQVVDEQSEGSAGLAQVTFRVRCETLGHGESVFLAQADNLYGSRVSAESELRKSEVIPGINLIEE